ncbi:MAG: hypothetical protein QG646_3518, partial [Euryarchaeota archaeon]|nr:hypothetical protein [Euryarchaeota archaeon]
RARFGGLPEKVHVEGEYVFRKEELAGVDGVNPSEWTKS